MGIEDGILFSVCAGILIGIKLYFSFFGKNCRKKVYKATDEEAQFEDIFYLDEADSKRSRFLHDLWYGSPIVITKTKGGETSTWTIGNGRG